MTRSVNSVCRWSLCQLESRRAAAAAPTMTWASQAANYVIPVVTPSDNIVVPRAAQMLSPNRNRSNVNVNVNVNANALTDVAASRLAWSNGSHTSSLQRSQTEKKRFSSMLFSSGSTSARFHRASIRKSSSFTVSTWPHYYSCSSYLVTIAANPLLLLLRCCCCFFFSCYTFLLVSTAACTFLHMLTYLVSLWLAFRYLHSLHTLALNIELIYFHYASTLT